jgi:tetraacyldisaccharide 4'-kinase
LTAYDDLFSEDFLLPTGNLRESRRGAQRADVIVVTKCPTTLTKEEQSSLKYSLNAYSNATIFFSVIAYDTSVHSKNSSISVAEIKQSDAVLLAGIAKPDSFFDYLANEHSVCLTYPDHHHFTENDILHIQQQAGEKKIVTTEKDYVRLKDSDLKDQLYYLPIRTSFINDSDQFDTAILDYLKC